MHLNVVQNNKQIHMCMQDALFNSVDDEMMSSSKVFHLNKCQEHVIRTTNQTSITMAHFYGIDG